MSEKMSYSIALNKALGFCNGGSLILEIIALVYFDSAAASNRDSNRKYQITILLLGMLVILELGLITVLLMERIGLVCCFQPNHERNAYHEQAFLNCCLPVSTLIILIATGGDLYLISFHDRSLMMVMIFRIVCWPFGAIVLHDELKRVEIMMDV